MYDLHPEFLFQEINNKATLYSILRFSSGFYLSREDRNGSSSWFLPVIPSLLFMRGQKWFQQLIPPCDSEPSFHERTEMVPTADSSLWFRAHLSWEDRNGSNSWFLPVIQSLPFMRGQKGFQQLIPPCDSELTFHERTEMVPTADFSLWFRAYLSWEDRNGSNSWFFPVIQSSPFRRGQKWFQQLILPCDSELTFHKRTEMVPATDSSLWFRAYLSWEDRNGSNSWFLPVIQSSPFMRGQKWFQQLILPCDSELTFHERTEMVPTADSSLWFRAYLSWEDRNGSNSWFFPVNQSSPFMRGQKWFQQLILPCDSELTFHERTEMVPTADSSLSFRAHLSREDRNGSNSWFLPVIQSLPFMRGQKWFQQLIPPCESELTFHERTEMVPTADSSLWFRVYLSWEDRNGSSSWFLPVIQSLPFMRGQKWFQQLILPCDSELTFHERTEMVPAADSSLWFRAHLSWEDRNGSSSWFLPVIQSSPFMRGQKWFQQLILPCDSELTFHERTEMVPAADSSLWFRAYLSWEDRKVFSSWFLPVNQSLPFMRGQKWFQQLIPPCDVHWPMATSNMNIGTAPNNAQIM